jgi:hypothetical protein
MCIKGDQKGRITEKKRARLRKGLSAPTKRGRKSTCRAAERGFSFRKAIIFSPGMSNVDQGGD